MTDPISSVDPTVERAAIKIKLETLQNGEVGKVYEGVDQGTVLAIDGFGNKLPYRDFEPGSTIPAASGRLMNAPQQAQPHIWAFQIHHAAPTRSEAIDLSTATDKLLIGWAPSENAGPIGGFYFQVYDNTAKNGDRVQWIATRFYETQLGQTPDFAVGQ